jgi:hypothetical protein
MKVSIANQSARQEAGFAKDLKAVADAQYKSAALGKLLQRIHYRGKARQCSGAQIVAIRKSAWDDDGIIAAQIRVAVPDKVDWLTYVFRDHVVSIVVAI